MHVVYFNRSLRDLPAATAVDLPELLSKSDAIAVTPPLNQASQGMIGTAELDLMKPTAILVSILPDAIINFDALAGALVSGRILVPDSTSSATHPITSGCPTSS
jgi:D-3-phosphoglycerate dehydrogenase